MKKFKFSLLIILALIISKGINAQNLSLNDLENICNRKNWESANQYLMNKKWEYFESKKGNTERYNTITWSYNKTYGDKAEGWLYLYTYEKHPNKIQYQIFNTSSYQAIQKSINAKGYKLQNSEIENNELISTYSNKNFILKVITQKRDRNISSRLDESVTAYDFLLIKKSGIYDTENGTKREYHFLDRVKVEYNLKDGELHGLVKYFYTNGKPELFGNYVNGKKHGKFLEYNEDGSIASEYFMKNGFLNGIVKTYENGKLSVTANYTNDVLEGEMVTYNYNESTGELMLKTTGHYLNGKKTGEWEMKFIYNDGTEHIVTKENYLNGKKNGFSQVIIQDSLIVSNYINDKLHGDFRVYTDFKTTLLGGLATMDTSKTILRVQGSYNHGLKSGYWKYYYFTKALEAQGEYKNGEKEGKWESFYIDFGDRDGQPAHYGNELFKVENFKNGKLNGKTTRFSFLIPERYKCDEVDENNQPVDSCFRVIYEKVLETSNYKNNKLDGDYELRDSLNNIITKGQYKDGKENGVWEYNISNDAKKTITFKDGNFKELIVYDSLGIKPKTIFEIFNEKSNSYNCRFTNYLSTETVSQVYTLIKENDTSAYVDFDKKFKEKLNSSSGSSIYKNGKYVVQDIKNKPLIEGYYFKENKNGDWVYYYYPQNVKVLIKYEFYKNIDEKYLTLDNQDFSGKFTFIDKTNNTKEIRRVKKGRRHGITRVIDTNSDKTLKKIKYKNGIIK